MPKPNWWNHRMKRLFSQPPVKNDRYDVLTHTGRTSGTTYQTPIEVIPVDGGFVISRVYGSSFEWVKTALASGTAILRTRGREVHVTNPRIMQMDDIRAVMHQGGAKSSRMMRMKEVIRMDAVTCLSGGPTGSSTCAHVPLE